MQTDATLLANNSQHCWMLHVPSVKPVKLFSQQLPTFLLFLDRRSVAQQCWIRLHSATLLGPRKLIMHGLKRLMGCILPAMHCRSQNCWELLHPFAHHCQHARSLRENYNNWLVPAYIASHGIVDYCLISALRKCYNHLWKKRRVTAMWLFEP